MPVLSEPLVERIGELTVQRKLTHEFIHADPTIIALVPVTKYKQPSGSFVWADATPRPPQTFKMIPMSAGTKPTTILNGVERIADYTILGMYDAEIEVEDHFTIDGIKYTVIAIADGHDYETKALVEAHG